MERAKTGHDKPERTTLRIEIAPRTIIFLLLAVASVWIAFELATVLTVITVALVLVGTLDPLVAWLERRGIRRGRALVLVFAVLILAIATVLLLTVPPLVSQLLTMLESAPKARDSLVEWLRHFKWAKPLVQSIKAIPINDLVVSAANDMLGYSSKLLTMIGYGISTLFLAIYLLADPVRSKGLLYAVIPRHYHIKLARILLELKVIVGGYMRGQLITSVVIFVFVFVLLTIYGVDNALALALFAGLTDIIPFVGGYIASAPAIIAVVPFGSTSIILVTVLMFAYQEFESRILVPRVYGRVLRLSPAIVIIALLVGGTLMGILGALIALPIAAGVQMVVRELRVELPGEAPQSDKSKIRDEKAETIYEALTEGVTAADAGVIASELAVQIKATERAGLTLSGNIPIQDPQPTMPTRLPTTDGAATAEAEESAEDEIKRAVDRAVDDDRS
ncbi:MAG: AI-2E family transporter [Myxococcales bacterium]|nr:AI-2E family transporter [Myxococcales bacterium]